MFVVPKDLHVVIVVIYNSSSLKDTNAGVRTEAEMETRMTAVYIMHCKQAVIVSMCYKQ